MARQSSTNDYSGEPVRLAGTLYGPHDKDTQIDRIIGLLDDLEAAEYRRAGAYLSSPSVSENPGRLWG